MQVTREVAEIINSVVVLAKNRHYELVTPELVLYVICGNKIFAEALWPSCLCNGERNSV